MFTGTTTRLQVQQRLLGLSFKTYSRPVTFNACLLFSMYAGREEDGEGIVVLFGENYLARWCQDPGRLHGET